MKHEVDEFRVTHRTTDALTGNQGLAPLVYVNGEAGAVGKGPEKGERFVSVGESFSGNKYHRKIYGFEGGAVTVDVYRVLDAFNVTDPGSQHAIKKLLCAGIRGKGDSIQDKSEAVDAVLASIDLEKHKELEELM